MLEETIKHFNQSFNKMDIFKDKHDVIVEYIEEVKKRSYNTKKSLTEHGKTLKNTIETFPGWIIS
jgi:hypothetical protein